MQIAITELPRSSILMAFLIAIKMEAFPIEISRDFAKLSKFRVSNFFVGNCRRRDSGILKFLLDRANSPFASYQTFYAFPTIFCNMGIPPRSSIESRIDWVDRLLHVQFSADLPFWFPKRGNVGEGKSKLNRKCKDSYRCFTRYSRVWWYWGKAS